ncbi:MAG: ABC transporter ATP-binding protein [Bacteroidales bacterium]|nr:ABC transporter ATP-binding protein [Bacteroidales bacterium]MCF8338039.1 ABC transporter ATP-binding protein [Bacteroidales bacterium]
MINTENLTKSYNDTPVLENINLKVGYGQGYALLGKNGAGKTTLINLMLDLLLPDSGKTQIMGKESQALTREDKQKLGAVPEDMALIEELNGYDFLYFIGKIYSIPKQTLQKRIDDLFGFFFENPKDLKKRISKYSSGMKKKLAFCAAVIHTPQVLILDEPFSGLDPLVAHQMIDFLKKYQRDDRVIFVSSHDLAYVEKIATHIGVLDQGRLQFDSTMEDFTHYGQNELDAALLEILKPSDSSLENLDWI